MYFSVSFHGEYLFVCFSCNVFSGFAAKVMLASKNDFRNTFFSSMLCQSESCSVMFNSLRPHGLFRPRNSPGQNTKVGSVSLLQGIFPTQGANPGLPHSLPSLYHKGSPLSYVRVCIKLAYFFLKCLVEFISQPI